MRALCRIGLSLLCFSFSASIVAQQDAAPPVTPPQQSALAPNEVRPHQPSQLVLDVNVNDRAGTPVSGLQATDFTVFDNGRPTKLLAFHEVKRAATAQPTPPVEIILLVDEVNTNFSRVAYERSQIEKFLDQNGGELKYPMSLAFFSDTAQDLQEHPTLSGKELLTAFDEHVSALRSIRRSTGFYGAVERFQLSLRMLQALSDKVAERPGRKMVIWISPGWPLLTGPNVELSNKERRGLFASTVSVSTSLRQSGITLYSIDPLGVDDAGSLRLTYYQEFLKPVTKLGQVDAGDLALQVLAVQSGGMALNTSNDITAQIQRCVDDADSFYTLTVAILPAERPDEYHSIVVKVETPGAKVRTRSGYYAQP
jgi:VWFA-related protein